MSYSTVLSPSGETTCSLYGNALTFNSCIDFGSFWATEKAEKAVIGNSDTHDYPIYQSDGKGTQAATICMKKAGVFAFAASAHVAVNG